MIAFLIDADNLCTAAPIDEAFQTLGRTEGSVAIRRAYGSAEKLKALANTLRIWAVRPFVNLPLTKNTTDLSLAVDAMELACTTPRLKLLAIGSGDLDFVPLVVRLRERGVKVGCVTERGKMARDAVPAYDQVIYVGGYQLDSALAEVKIVAATAVPDVPKKTSIAKSPPAMPVPKAAAIKNAPDEKAPTQKANETSNAITVPEILAAAPDLKTGNGKH